MEINKRVVVITGASKGIGLATAYSFAKKGELLVLNYFQEKEFENIERVKQVAEENGGEVIAIKADISKQQEAKSMIAEAEGAFGRIDVLVNNAGIIHSKASHLVQWEEWESVIATNLSGTFACIQAVLPGMISRKSGRIINISSEQGIIGFPTYAAYCASKGGVIALTKSIAKEVAVYGILVNSVAPGPIETDLLKQDTIEYNDKTRMQIPLQRFGSPEEVAATVEFLAGEGGSYYVGQILSPNGGTAI